MRLYQTKKNFCTTTTTTKRNKKKLRKKQKEPTDWEGLFANKALTRV